MFVYTRFIRLSKEWGNKSERVSVRQLGGPGNFKLKSSEMAGNASKTVNTDVKF